MRYLTRLLAVCGLVVSLSACEGTLDMDAFDQQTQQQLDAQPVVQAPQPQVARRPPTQPEPEVEAPQPEPDPTIEEPVEEPMEEVPTRPEPGTVVEFTIQQGTGAQAWNTKEEPVVVYVGQILRLTNFDDRDHQLHSGDAGAVDHGSRIRPGQSLDMEVKRTLEVGDSAKMWDHGDGRDAPFWVVSKE